MYLLVSIEVEGYDPRELHVIAELLGKIVNDVTGLSKVFARVVKPNTD